METAATVARRQKEQEASRKRQLIADELDSSAKRRRLDAASASVDPVAVFSSSNTDLRIGTFDARSLPVPTVVELLVHNFTAVDERRLQFAIAEARAKLPPDAAGQAAAAADAATTGPVRAMDPLKADLGDEELHLKAEVAKPDPVQPASSETTGPVAPLPSFTAASLEDLSSDLLESARLTSAKARTAMVLAAVRRICDAGADGNAPAIWVPLVVRLITRGLASFAASASSGDDDADEPGAKEGVVQAKKEVDGEAEAGTAQQGAQEEDEEYERREALRQYLFDFVLADAPHRFVHLHQAIS